MALGRHYIGPITLDSASDPDDTTILAAQGAAQRGYIKQLVVVVTGEVASTTITFEDGVGGTPIAAPVSSAATGTTVVYQFKDDEEGIRLSPNAILNATIAGDTGVTATVQAVIDVRGGGA